MVICNPPRDGGGGFRNRRLLAVGLALVGLAWGGVLRAQDADGDRLPDATELAIGTNPAVVDTDGDGDSDWLEFYRCRSPLDATDRGQTRCRFAAGTQPPDLVWSQNGAIAGKECVQVTNAFAPAEWQNIHLCSTGFNGWRWSSAGPIPGMRCMLWADVFDPPWNNNRHYLCAAQDAPLRMFPDEFRLFTNGLPHGAAACVRLLNDQTSLLWNNNFLCQSESSRLIEAVSCANCGSDDSAGGVVLAFTGHASTGSPLNSLPSGITVDSHPCIAVGGQPLQCRLPAGALGDLGTGRLLATPLQYLIVDFPPPEVTAITPANPPANGGTLVLDGRNFGVDAATVTVDDRPCEIVSRTPTRITCTAPPRPTGVAPLPVAVVVTVGDLRTSGLQVTYRAPPRVKGIEVVGPAPTTGGGRIVVLGTDLDTAPDITLASDPCELQSAATDVVVCRMPPGRGTGQPVRLRVAGVEFQGAVDYDPPVVTGVSGLGGPTRGGTIVAVEGRNFGASPAGLSIDIDGFPCRPEGPGTEISHTRIQCVLPEGQGVAVPVVVNVLGRDSNPGTYRYAAPVLQPLDGVRLDTAGDELLELRGSDLGTRGIVRVAGALCRPDGPGTGHTHELIRCRTPEGLGSGQLVQLDSSGHFASTTVSYRAPMLSGGHLGAGPTLGGNEITLFGNNLGGASLALPRSVRVGTNDCLLLEAGHTALRCRVPAGQGRDLPVVVRVGDQPSGALAYSYLPPFVSDVIPGTLPVAGQVVVSVVGRNLGTEPVVTIGGLGCPRSGPPDHMLFRCTAPARAAGPAILQLAAGNQDADAWTVQYVADPVMVALHKAGDGFGEVGSTPAGLACDATCTTRENLFAPGTAITLTAQPESGSTFLGWQGPCTGTGATCSFTADDDTAVGLSFSSPLFGSGFEGEGPKR